MVRMHRECAKNYSGQLVPSWKQLSHLHGNSTRSKTHAVKFTITVTGQSEICSTRTLNASPRTCTRDENCKEDKELFRSDILDVKMAKSSSNTKRKTTDSERNQQWKGMQCEARNDIKKSGKPFKEAISEKRSQLRLLENYCSALSDKNFINLKGLASGSCERSASSLERSTSC